MEQTSTEKFKKWLNQCEDIDLEFKLASSNFDEKRGSLFDYIAAIANGRGGKLILGVQEKPREVKGTNYALGTHNKLSHEIWGRLAVHVDVEEFLHQGCRVLIFHIPKHQAGRRVKSGAKGDKFTYPIRRGESLGEMDDQRTKEILNETDPDFSARIVPGLTLDSLDHQAIVNLRKKWAKEAKRGDFEDFDDEKILRNMGLLSDKGITYAGLILVGKKESIFVHLPDAEIIYEYRQDPKQTHYDFRKNWRDALVNIDDEIWETVNARNVRIPFQEGFLQREIWGYEEKSIREAVHNAVMHRDYSIKGKSIFIKASPQEFFIESPGALPAGITLDNILFEKAWRNRALAEALEKIGFAERSSQGMDDIFEQTIRDGKGLPDLSKTDHNSVRLLIPAQVKDKEFILYLERIANKHQIGFSFEEIFGLENIRESGKISRPEFKNKFLKLGIIEAVGKTRGTRYILSHRYYATIGKSGIHTRIKGLNRAQKKQLIINHLAKEKKGYSVDIQDALQMNQVEVNNLLQELKRGGQVSHKGHRRWGFWELNQL